MDVADSLGSDIIRWLIEGGSDQWKRSVQEGGDGVVLGSVDLEKPSLSGTRSESRIGAQTGC